MLSFLRIILFASSIVFASNVGAAPITFGFKGETLNILGNVPAGLEIQGSFTFDPATMTSFNLPSQTSTNTIFEPLDTFTLQIGADTFTPDLSNPGSINVEDTPFVGDDIADAYRLTLNIEDGQSILGQLLGQFRIVVFLPTRVFDNATLPTNPDFFLENRGVSTQLFDENDIPIEIARTTEMFLVVPSPQSVLLLLIGFVFLLTSRRIVARDC